jgi:hypothetical protein
MCLVYACLLFLPAIESNNTECTEEGEVYEYQEEEDQGQANQGKCNNPKFWKMEIKGFS